MPKRYRNFISLYLENKCHLTKSCEQAGIHKTTFYNWMKDPIFAEKMKDIEESIIDTAEAKLIAMLESGDRWALKYWLSHKGLHRGWQDKQEIDLKASGDIKLEIVRRIVDRSNVDPKTTTNQQEQNG